MSSNETVSNKVGNATDGTVGEETLLHQAQTLASHGLDFAKVKTGISKPSTTAEVAPPTLGGLFSEAKSLAGSALEAAQTVVAGSPDAPKEGYVAHARDLAAKGLGTAHSYVAAAGTKVSETTSTTSTNDIKAAVAEKESDAAAAVEAEKASIADAVSASTTSAIEKADEAKAETKAELK